ncbi:MAG: acyltransferase [Pseudoxanthomonas sp.]
MPSVRHPVPVHRSIQQHPRAEGKDGLQYVPALDGLRAAAVLLVLAFHARAPGFNGGFLGVDLFFVLSGYLITRLLADQHDREGSIKIGHFYVRRLRRLYPALILLVIAYLACTSTLFPEAIDRARDAAVAILYFSDYGQAYWQVPKVLGHTWSLSVEEHFYLIWPLAMILVLRLDNKRRVLALLTMFLAASAWRWLVLDWPTSWSHVYFGFDTRLSGLILGGAIGLWRPVVQAWFPFFGITLFTVAVWLADWRLPASLKGLLLLAEIGAALIVLGAGHIKFLAMRPIAWLGRMSYGIYLWHYPVVYWMRRSGHFDWQEIFMVAAVLSTVMAALSYYFVERRFHKRQTESHADHSVPPRGLFTESNG